MSACLNIPIDVQEMLDRDETPVWCDKPLRKVLLARNIPAAIIGTIWGLIPLAIILTFTPNALTRPDLLGFIGFWVALALLAGYSGIIATMLGWKNLYYILTNKRLIIRKGIVGIDYDILNLDTVKEVSVDVGFWDQKYGTGTLTLQAIGVSPLKLRAVREPRKIYSMIREYMKREEK